MRKIFQYFRNHLKEDFNLGYYITIICFLTLCLIYNYSVNFDHKVLDHWRGTSKGFLYYLLFYSTPYYFAFLTYALFYKKRELLKNYRFWIKSLFFISLFSFDADQTLHHKIVYSDLVIPEAKYFVNRCLNNLSSLCWVFLPLLIYFLLFEKQKESFYGLKFKKDVNLKPYFILLLLMLPVVVIASFGKDFNTYYPRYPDITINNALNIPKGVTIGIFEFCYGWDFINTELFFRGALILGMASLLGKGAIMPMVSFYVFIHFGKPVGEAMGSFFGGYILGVIAYYTRNIWGGACIHLGIAWMMEIAAFLQR